METPGTGTSFKPEEAYAAAAERFFELIKTFGMAAGTTTDWKTLAAPLATQFERWLQTSQTMTPWFGAATPGSFGSFGLGAPTVAAFGPLPLGPAAVHGADAPRALELLGRLAQLQSELAKHWSQIAGTATQRFVTRIAALPAAPATPQQALKLYELWVNCAEEAYAATVHTDDFGRLQAELANTTAALLAEQRRQAESLVRAFGLPTRNEVDTLYAQVKDLRRALAELTHPPGPPTPGREARGAAKAQRGAKHTGAPRPRPRPARRARRPKR
jgi:Poly(R)-hydroxyalkanoic acid synthase subunit (PHA_synth_III_E)